MPPKRLPRTCLLVLFVTLATNCSARGLERGIQSYENARFADALAELERTLAGAPRLSRSDWARYALYRGLTELALGNASVAYGWLVRAQVAVDRQPSLLGPEDRARLGAAWRSLGLMPAQR